MTVCIIINNEGALKKKEFSKNTLAQKNYSPGTLDTGGGRSRVMVGSLAVGLALGEKAGAAHRHRSVEFYNSVLKRRSCRHRGGGRARRPSRTR